MYKGNEGVDNVLFFGFDKLVLLYTCTLQGIFEECDRIPFIDYNDHFYIS